MSFYYRVILKPSDVKFTSRKIPSQFGDGGCLETLVEDVEKGINFLSDVSVFDVVWHSEKWEWYTLDNRLLWVFRELEKAGKLSYIAMRRVEYEDDWNGFPDELFESPKLVKIKFDETNSRNMFARKSVKESSSVWKRLKHLDIREHEGVEMERDERNVRGRDHVPQVASEIKIISRASSVCSLTSEHRAKDDWGRRGKSTSFLSDDELPNNSAYSLDLGNEAIHVNLGCLEEVNQTAEEDATENQKKTSVLNWVKNRKKFCEMYSNNYSFQEYVVQNIIPESPISKLKPAVSMVSIDSAYSNTSLSSILRSQREIGSNPGYSGYANFDKYNREYLGKLRKERMESRHRLKPYDTPKKNPQRVRSRLSSCGSDIDGDSRSWTSKSVTVQEETITRRTFSESLHYRKSRRDSTGSKDHSSHSAFREVSRKLCERGSVSDHRSRHRTYSDADRYKSKYPLRRCNSIDSARSLSSSRPLSRSKTPARYFAGSSTGLASTAKDSSRRASCHSVFRMTSVPAEKMYQLWQSRREQYLKARYGSTLSLDSCNSLAVVGYTCGLCFKSFQTRVRCEQHSDELMHFGCITCGRFFASHTALGQHVEQSGHRKD